jgi:hypothetical protein
MPTPLSLKAIICIICLMAIVSCNPFKKSHKVQSPLENAIINMTEEEVRARLGEPDIVSKTPENRIIWTYKPSWKLMPDNKGTVYLELENGKVVKMIKAR